MTKLWLLQTTEKGDISPFSPFYSQWDCVFGFVIEAETEERARAIASQNAGDEGKDAWLSTIWTSCCELVPDGIEGVWLTDMLEG